MTNLDQQQASAVIDQFAARALSAARAWGESDIEQRAGLLRALADELDAHVDELVGIADEETGLGVVRLKGEVARTTFQLRGFAKEVEAGVPYATIDDEAVAGAPPAGRPRLTRVQVPLGPVAMFSASNFPFAFSVLGGDTASALAAGCPVIVKPHTGHARLSTRVAALASAVLERLSIDPGVFSVIDVPLNRDANAYLVKHPAIKAVAFTGSYQGGVALWHAANDRPIPIPFFGELGSINPVVVLPAAIESDTTAPAKALAASILQGSGQFCTSPGVIIVLDDAAGNRFVAELGDALSTPAPHRMLSGAIRNGFEDAAARIKSHDAIAVVCEGQEAGEIPAPKLFSTTGAAFMDDVGLHEEMFGPAAVVVSIGSLSEVPRILASIGGTLTVTVWGADADTQVNRDIVHAAQGIAGRVLFGGVPTGVAVTHAQQHGGPWPASTNPQTTSVGYAALQRFLRPVALQDAPDWLVD